MNLKPLLSILSILLDSEISRILFADFLQFWRTTRFRGLYKVKELHASLEIIDKTGKTATYTKRQEVQYIQDGVFAIQDQAWGDGSIFADYKCSPGVLVDKYQEGYRWHLLISLRGIRKKGDTEKFVIERTIENGFITPNETFQIQIDHPMEILIINITFPRSRIPQNVVLMENNLKLSHVLGTDFVSKLPDGRVCYTWKTVHPRLYEGYIVKWEW